MTNDAVSASAPVVRFEGVHMAFSSGLKAPVWALRGMSIEVHRGQVLGLLGPNGSGKTTSLSCLLGLLEPGQGTVSLWGRRVRPMRPAAGNQPYGVLLEDTRLPPFLSVEQSLRMVCTARGLEGSKQAREIERVAELCGVGSLLTRTTAVLSKGQARKAGLAAALVGDPALLILDEPSAGLDVAARVEFDNLLRNLHDGERTIIVASHLLSDVEATCSHIAIMDQGRVVFQDATEGLLRRARETSGSVIHVDDTASAVLDELGLGYEASRYPGLVRVRSDTPDKELLLALLARDVLPRRVEPAQSLVSVYLDLTREGTES